MNGRFQPLHFTPILKEKPWGGRNLAQFLGKFLPTSGLYGESWELADCGSDVSIVASGTSAGTTIRELVRDYPEEFLGSLIPEQTEFPLLIKYLDAAEWLSIQVHPNQEQAPNGIGKHEAWVVLKAVPGSSILAGLKRGVNRKQLEQAVSSGTVVDCLHSVPVSPGDCFNIPAGTLHAIGPGIVLAEIQQQSDTTYRLHDWNRGRELHVANALDCINFNAGPVHPVHPRYRAAAEGVIEELVDNPFFSLSRSTHVSPFELQPGPAFSVMMVIHGRGRVFQGDGIRDVRTGSTIVIPASSQAAMCIPNREMTVLNVTPSMARQSLNSSVRLQRATPLTVISNR